jgi:phosphate uptake regulator
MWKQIFGSGSPSKLIQDAFKDVSQMIERSGQMFDLAMRTLIDNEVLTVDLEQMDDAVDEGERLVRRAVLQHLAVDPRQDLVASLILVSIVNDVERIGDFARGMAELVKLASTPRGGILAEGLRTLSSRVRPMFEVCERAFREDDTDLARQVIQNHLELKKNCLEYVQQVVASDLTPDMAVVYASGARMIRRVSAHLSNISSAVVQPYDRIRHGDEEA